jgi:rubrerythrin
VQVIGMALNSEAITSRLRLLSALVEMRNLEALVASEASRISELVDLHQAKEIFNRWAQDSETHRKTCQHMIDKLCDTVPQSERAGSIEASLSSTHIESNIFERFPELKENKLTARVLYYLAEKHLILEGDAGCRYVEMAEIADDQETERMLMELSKAEEEHHREAQMLVDSLQKILKKGETSTVNTL